MPLTQTVDIPENRRLTIDVPREVPTGPAILSFMSVNKTEEAAYGDLSKEDAISLTAEVIEKYRPALDAFLIS